MTSSMKEFSDILDKRFQVNAGTSGEGICNPLRFERGTRSFGASLFKGGIDRLGALNGKSVRDVLRVAPTTRPNFNRSLDYLAACGITLG